MFTTILVLAGERFLTIWRSSVHPQTLTLAFAGLTYHVNEIASY
ncbi:MAG: hypothetical protein ACI9FJ_000441 [Alteromonadaceae bacterium]